MRRRLAVGGAFVVLVAVIAYAAGGGSGPAKGHPAVKSRTASVAPAGPPQLVVSMASWQLASPLSRAVALPANGGIDVLGGLTGTGTGDTTSGAIVQIDPVSGQSQNVGTLTVPVHDAAGAVIGGRDFVFGGGATALTADSQSFSPAAGQTGSAGQAGAATTIAGQLPKLRADLTSATAPDGTVYLVGGYDGTNFTQSVLSTRNGSTFAPAGQLDVPVRYPAAAVAGGQLFVVGGDSGSSPTSTSAAATDDIQVVDLKTGQTTIAGHMPAPLSHASAATIDGSVYVFGGRSGGNVADTVYKLSAGPTGVTATSVGTLPVGASDMAVASVGGAVYLIGGEGQTGAPGQSVMVARMVPASTPAGTAQPGTMGAPFVGHLLIADRGNDRLLLVNSQKQISWTFPSASHPAPPEGFYFPDDAFFINHGTQIITNQEDQNTIEVLSYPSGQLVSSYGHANVPGSSPGYLNQPDDAFMLNNGEITVADAKNCRILFINPDMTYKSAIGTPGNCTHNLPTDVAYPNGDTPLPDGNFLVSEIIGSYIDEMTQSGQVIWSVHLPIAYPSDPQQIGPDLYLVADYSKPGGILEFNRQGQILWQYRATSGEGMLDHPSLAEMLPSGLICVNDDYRDRVVIIDPKTNRIVWQYGVTDTPGTAPGMLKIPDGFDLLLPNGTTPTHLPASGPGTTAPATGTAPAATPAGATTTTGRG